MKLGAAPPCTSHSVHSSEDGAHLRNPFPPHRSLSESPFVSAFIHSTAVVLGNVTLGLAPIAWGLLIDAVGAHSPIWLGLAWNRYTVFFAAAALAFTISLTLAQRLHEPEAASMEDLLRDILIQSPQRFWIRFWPRGGA